MLLHYQLTDTAVKPKFSAQFHFFSPILHLFVVSYYKGIPLAGEPTKSYLLYTTTIVTHLLTPFFTLSLGNRSSDIVFTLFILFSTISNSHF
jgi:hypothetical protein